MTTESQCSVSVTLSPTSYEFVHPRCKILFGKEVKNIILSKTETFLFEQRISQDTDLIIEFYGKENRDSVGGRDLRINIDSISIMGIEDKKFIYQGIYCPIYPEPWASQQKNAGVSLPSEIKYADSLGWNGKWSLTITNPPFTFIHKTLDLGWIYPYNHLYES